MLIDEIAVWYIYVYSVLFKYKNVVIVFSKQSWIDIGDIVLY